MRFAWLTSFDRWANRITASLFAAGALYAAFRGLTFTDYTDFSVYYRAGAKFWGVVIGAHPDFSISVGDTSPYRYSPLLGWIFAPLSLLSESYARALWMLSGWAFFAASWMRVSKVFQLPAWALLVGVLGTIRFAVDNSNIGQISAFVTWLLIQAATRQTSVGYAAHALTLFAKMQPVVLLAIPAFRRDTRAVGTTMGFIALFLVLSLTFGLEPFQVWLGLLGRSDTVLDPAIAGNQSLYGAALRAFGSPLGIRLYWLVTAISGLVCLAVWRRRNWELPWAWAMGLALLPVFGILTWKNTYLSWIYPFAYFLPRYPRLTSLVAGAFVIPSQGILGSHWNGFFMNVGLLPVSALLGALALGMRAERSCTHRTAL